MGLSSKPVENPAYTYRAIVNQVVNGDTVRLDVDFGVRKWMFKFKCDLMGVDAPEMRGDTLEAGRAAKQALFDLIPPGTGILITTVKDGDDWYVEIWKDRENINKKMVELGHAVFVEKPKRK